MSNLVTKLRGYTCAWCNCGPFLVIEAAADCIEHLEDELAEAKATINTISQLTHQSSKIQKENI